jgi:hypothetical protein
MDGPFPYKPNASYPLNITASGGYYGANQQIDFKINAIGKKIVKKSFKLNGTVKIVNLNTDPISPVGNSNVYLSPAAGLHGLIQNIITTTEKGGVLENILNYGRSVAMHQFSITSETELGEVGRSMQGIFPNNNTVLAQQFAQGQAGSGNIDFSLPLDFCLNHSYDVSTGEDCDIPYSMVGSDANPLQITLRLSPLQQMIFGPDAGNFTVEIYNLMLVWAEVPDDGKHGKVAVKVSNMTKNTINSAYSTQTSFLPIPSTGMQVSYVSLANEADQTKDYYQIQALPKASDGTGIKSLQLLLDDTLQLFKYQILTQQEQIYSNMLLQGSMTTSLTRSTFYQNQQLGDIFSMIFPYLLVGHKLSVVLYNPNITVNTPFNAYAFYQGLVEL